MEDIVRVHPVAEYMLGVNIVQGYDLKARWTIEPGGWPQKQDHPAVEMQYRFISLAKAF